jgi:predicted dehydrogenase
MKNRPRISRRTFLSQTTAAAVAASVFPSIIPAPVLGKNGSVAPGNRLGVACIGSGEQGCGVLGNFISQPTARVLAVCDVNRRHLEIARDQVNARYKNQDCATYTDFRELLQRPDIDVVLIATPDHWHVLNALAAVRAGKDVYLEKPLGLSLSENQALRAEVQKHGRVFQFGTQQRSDFKFRFACELVRNGRIGRLKQINVWAPGSAPGGSTEQVPPPEGLDFDFWLGPAPARAYTRDLCAREMPRKTWWYIHDYTLGFISGWGIHPIDIALWGAGDLLNGTVEVAGKATFPGEGICDTSTTWDVDYQFSSGIKMRFIGVRGGVSNPAGLEELNAWKQRYNRKEDHGTAFEGTDGWVFVSRDGIKAFPESILDEHPDRFEIRLRQSGSHVGNLLDAARTRGQTVCPIEEAVQGDMLCHIADHATRLNRKLTWDTRAEQFVGDPEAQKLIAARPMRARWKL